MLGCSINWALVMEDYTRDDNEEKDFSKVVSKVKESTKMEEDPSKDSS